GREGSDERCAAPVECPIEWLNVPDHARKLLVGRDELVIRLDHPHVGGDKSRRDARQHPEIWKNVFARSRQIVAGRANLESRRIIAIETSAFPSVGNGNCETVMAKR